MIELSVFGAFVPTAQQACDILSIDWPEPELIDSQIMLK